MLLALRPLLLEHGLSPDKVAKLIEEAQNDLYHPKVRIRIRVPASAVVKPGTDVIGSHCAGSALLLLAPCPRPQGPVNN
jgi:hypothetical protein